MKTKKQTEYWRYDYTKPASEREGPYHSMEEAENTAKKPYDLIFRHDVVGHMLCVTTFAWQGAAGTGAYVPLNMMTFVKNTDDTYSQLD